MRAFPIVLVAVTCSAFVAFAVFMSTVSFWPFGSSAEPVGTTTTTPGPAPQELKVMTPEVRPAKYLYHCAGPAGAPATRVQIDASKAAVHPVEGAFPQQVPSEGYRQDIEVEVHGEKAAAWQVEIDYTLDGVARTEFAPAAQALLTEPRPTDADGHWVWCDRQWRPGERC
jgi:hypothetical protein